MRRTVLKWTKPCRYGVPVVEASSKPTTMNLVLSGVKEVLTVTCSSSVGLLSVKHQRRARVAAMF